jgi:DNA repair protein RadC
MIAMSVPENRTPRTRIPVYTITLKRSGSIAYPTLKVVSSREAATLLWEVLAEVDREHFIALYLDQRHQCIGINTVSIGNLTNTLTHPREFFKGALLCNAAAVIAGHNHPSGIEEPSRDDLVLTERLYNAGRILGIPLLDHIIIGAPPRYWSAGDSGLLPGKEASKV